MVRTLLLIYCVFFGLNNNKMNKIKINDDAFSCITHLHIARVTEDLANTP